jgi:hypothetical protein
LAVLEEGKDAEDAEGQTAGFWEDSAGGEDSEDSEETWRRFGFVLVAKAKEARRAFWDLLRVGIEESWISLRVD